MNQPGLPSSPPPSSSSSSSSSRKGRSSSSTHIADQFVLHRCEESLQNTLRAASDTSTLAERTAFKLNEQTEVLEGIDINSDEISQNLEVSQYLLNGISSWWSTFTNMFTTSPPSAPALEPCNKSVNSSRPAPPAAAAAAAVRQQELPTKQLSTNNGFTTDQRDRNNVSQLVDHRFNKSLHELSGMLGDIHERAVEMNTHIDYQNKLLEGIQSKVEHNNVQMEKQKRDMNALLVRR